jgi:signal transduction histidine kinase
MASDELRDDVDKRIPKYIEATERLRQGEFNVDIPTDPADEVGKLGIALQNLARNLHERYLEIRKLDEITSQINAGVLLDDVLENVYESFKGIIPYNRIGFSLIEAGGKQVRAYWARTDQPAVELEVGYSAPLEGSSLKRILETGEPRIINDLVDYYMEHPQSESTLLMLKEGIRSSLTGPLIANGVPVGFMFFSSVEPKTYSEKHIAIFHRIASQLSVIVEKGRLISELARQKEMFEQQNRRLRDLNEELRRANALKNTFLGIAAHDLRNPINNIRMSAQLLTEPGIELPREEYIVFLGDIDNQADYMLGLINDLLDVSQIESGRLVLNLETVDLPKFLEDTAHRHAALAASKGTHVLLETVPPGQVRADPIRLRQIVDNLVSNAVKYSPQRSVVRVRAFRTNGMWRIEVEDEGPGIRQEEQENLFEWFGRIASSKPTGDEKSTGLGLAITRRAVEAHGGEVGVESEVGVGSTFWFTVPAAGAA